MSPVENDYYFESAISSQVPQSIGSSVLRHPKLWPWPWMILLYKLIDLLEIKITLKVSLIFWVILISRSSIGLMSKVIPGQGQILECPKVHVIAALLHCIEKYQVLHLQDSVKVLRNTISDIILTTLHTMFETEWINTKAH